MKGLMLTTKITNLITEQNVSFAISFLFAISVMNNTVPVTLELLFFSLMGMLDSISCGMILFIVTFNPCPRAAMS